MRHPLTLAVTVLLAAPAVAQTAGTVQDITVVGTSELLANYLRATLTVQPGAALSSVNLRQVEQEVLASGYFKTAVAELRTVGGKDTLQITVTSNPTISAVNATGLTFLPAEGFKKSIGELLNIAPGATLNTQRLEQAKEALASNYASEGYPFAPSISSDVKTNTDGTATVNFVVDETAPIKRVEVSGVTLLPSSTVTAIFKPLYDAKKFTPDAYYAAVQGLQQAYDQAGYLQAGVDTRTSTLADGVLKVQVVEGKVAAINTSDLGNPQATLQTQQGKPVTLASLQADVRTLANQTGKPVGFALQPDAQNPGQVTVLFGAADVASGPVKSIAVSGNTLVPTAQLQAAIKTKVGDTYTPQLAQEDFLALRDVYRKAGYEISTRDAITFTDGVLTYTVREVKLVGYELQWAGKHRTVDRVILRELPEPGKAFNLNELRASLGAIARLGFVKVTTETVRSDPQTPENVTYVLGLSETTTGIPVNLGLTYDSFAGGWGGDAAYTNTNAFGLGHNFTVGVGAQQNEAGQSLVGNVSYTIPWLDLDFLDFRKNRTALSVAAGSNVTGNTPILTTPTSGTLTSSDGTKTVQPDAGSDTGFDYTTRTTSFSVSAGRNLTKNLSANVGVGVSYRTYYLEALKADTTTAVQDGNAKVKVKSTDASGNVTETEVLVAPTYATPLIPDASVTTRISGGLSYDSTDNAEFPGAGLRGGLAAGYNIGRQGDTPLSWTDVQAGIIKYYGFGRTLEKELNVQTKQQVFAVRLNAGTILNAGTAPAGTGFSIGGGSSPNPAFQLRGLDNAALFGTHYVTSSAEYRYDFGLKSGIAQGLYGVLFADAGTAWSDTTAAKLNYGFGAGVQLNLGIGGALLPSLRFDYGYSPQNGSGKFSFRLGNFW
ncbi:outer membrane protein assembly factor BamA [Deinococcus metalli]|uniref:Outer membrane protein n=1 Tax=Deinococcus metalli TaxID=1141878 RepID=A0A7W8KAU9_9DEIO|nr:POTRA domain-containing protein [Deinococcus metalli]MBB5374867.1 outer membrane protein assembly factor BamA [Deinococcus metalli]GHF33109.1 outer membrane protein [Deinococcus metalli]